MQSGFLEEILVAKPSLDGPRGREERRGERRGGKMKRGEGKERVVEERISNETKCCQFINWNSGYLGFSCSVLAIFP